MFLIIRKNINFFNLKFIENNFKLKILNLLIRKKSVKIAQYPKLTLFGNFKTIFRLY